MVREEWRYFTTEPGELSATICGISTTHELCVDHLGILTPLVLHTVLILVKELATYGWIMCNAGVMKVPFRCAHTMDGELITAVILKMHQSFVLVSLPNKFLKIMPTRPSCEQDFSIIYLYGLQQ